MRVRYWDIYSILKNKWELDIEIYIPNLKKKCELRHLIEIYWDKDLIFKKIES